MRHLLICSLCLALAQAECPLFPRMPGGQEQGSPTPGNEGTGGGSQGGTGGGQGGGTGTGINAGPFSRDQVPEYGEPVTVQVISDCSVAATVTVSYHILNIEVRRSVLRVPSRATMNPVGPDLAAIVRINGTYDHTGAPTPSKVYVLNTDFVAGSVILYIIPDPDDRCPDDTGKRLPGVCGCGVPDVDSDGDGTMDCVDLCPSDADKINPGVCGCGVPDEDSDRDGTMDCDDACPNDPNKTAAGACGCNKIEDAADSDGDGAINCLDGCPRDANKTSPGRCGCGVVEDADGDGVVDCGNIGGGGGGGGGGGAQGCRVSADGLSCTGSCAGECVPTSVRVDYNHEPPTYRILECACQTVGGDRLEYYPPDCVFCTGSSSPGNTWEAAERDNGDYTVDYWCLAACCDAYAGTCSEDVSQLACNATWLGPEQGCSDCQAYRGACCNIDRSGNCEPNMLRDECLTRNGSWLGEGSSCASCPPTGACCRPWDGTCREHTTSSECYYWGEWQGAGTTCADCPQVLGPCCGAEGPGTCSEELTEAACAMAGGIWLGVDDVSCADCPPLGACCDENFGYCEDDRYQQQCYWGTWHEGAICDDQLCPMPPIGACCDSYWGYCAEGVFEADCWWDEWLGAGSTCAECPSPPLGACCDTYTGYCEEQSAYDCWWGNWKGEGTTCADDCPAPPIGACCDTYTGYCQEVPEYQCYYVWTEGEACGDACPTPEYGACCNQISGICEDNVSEYYCYAPNTFLGNGSDCEECTAQVVACCLPDGSCADLGHMQCVEAGGDTHEPGTTCATTECRSPKWSQPPTFSPSAEHWECFWGWDDQSLFQRSRIVTDDWVCVDGMELSGIHWWGSYADWTDTVPPPNAPDAFHIAVWTNVEAGVDQPFAHPGTLIVEGVFPRSELNERHVGCDSRWPERYWPESTFRYDLASLPAFDCSAGGSEPITYWLSISAVYGPLAACSGDVNGDGEVGAADLGIVQCYMGCAVGEGDPACDASDVDGDGDVDDHDYQTVWCQRGTWPPNPYCCLNNNIAHPWGWLTREQNTGASAVRIFDPTGPRLGSSFASGEPIESYGVGCDAAFVLSAGSAGGRIIYVDRNAKFEHTDGMSWVTAFTELQSALAIAQTGDEIRVADGTYRPDWVPEQGYYSNDRAASFKLIDGVAIKGGFAGQGAPDPDARDVGQYVTTLTGEIGEPESLADNCLHVVNCGGTNVSALLDGFTITNGNADWIGWPDNAGGGVLNISGSPMIINCTFRNNSAVHGGGMYNFSSGPTLAHCTFAGNSAVISGGGMCNFDANPGISNTRFLGNTAVEWGGGGISNQSLSSPTLANCIFSGNSASGCGAGILNHGGCQPTLVNCTFSGNATTGQDHGGGICNLSASVATLTNCILWANSAVGGMGEPGQVYSDDTGWSVVNHCCIQGLTGALGGTGNISDDPLLADPDGADNVLGNDDDNLRPTGGSPCIDAGNNAAVPVSATSDPDGKPRFVDDPDTNDCSYAPGTCGTPPIVDIGAYEYTAP